MSGTFSGDGDADQSSERNERRATIIAGYRQEKARRFQAWLKEDPVLLAQTFIDPLGTLAKHGMLELGDREVTLQMTHGSLLDVARLREAVAARGLGILQRKKAGVEASELLPVGVVGIEDRLCGSIYVDGVYWGDGCIDVPPWFWFESM
jgi:hypothetical protein